MKLVAKKACKSIRGAEVLRDISLELEEGTIYGFIGRNGSGKTMLFRALSGLIRLPCIGMTIVLFTRTT